MARSGRTRRAGAALFALAAAPALSGCVAAAALPVLAAGGVMKARTDGEPVSTAVQTGMAADEAASSRPIASQGTETGYRLTALTELPVPTSGGPRSAISPDGRTTGYTAFADYAAMRAAQPVIGTQRHSAMLADPTVMVPNTRECSVQPASVLIDLDPGQSAFDPEARKPAEPDLVRRLAALREMGVIIGWVSGHTADRAGMVRAALRQSGLDPDGRDELVLLRFPDERKQTRRDDFARSHCVLAIAGDEKADFDELFAYLRDPALALPLDRLIGAGWFIVPPPLATN